VFNSHWVCVNKRFSDLKLCSCYRLETGSGGGGDQEGRGKVSAQLLQPGEEGVEVSKKLSLDITWNARERGCKEGSWELWLREIGAPIMEGNKQK